MKKTYILRLRVSREQMVRVKEDAYLRGFPNVASYLSYLVFQRSLEMEQKINFIYTKLHQL